MQLELKHFFQTANFPATVAFQFGIESSEFFLLETTLSVRSILKTAFVAAAAFVLVPAALGDSLRLPPLTPFTPEVIPTAVPSTDKRFLASEIGERGIFSLVPLALEPFSAVITTDLDPDERGAITTPLASEALLKLVVDAPEPPSVALFSLGIVGLYLCRRTKRSLRRQRHLNRLRRRVKTESRMMAS